MRITQPLLLSALAALTLFSCNTSNTNSKGTRTNEDSTTDITLDTVKEIVLPEPVEEGGIKYKTYNNDTYNFSIDYPLGILKPQGESGSGDGQIFKSEDEKCTLWAYRDFRDNVSEGTYTIENAYKEDLRKDNPDHPEREITYKQSGSNFYVISGFEGNKIFYQKTIMKKDQLITLLLEYKKSEKDKYQAITEHISRSLR